MAEFLDLNTLAFAHVRVPAFDTRLFLLALLGGLAAASFVTPRLWCRFLCPAGALLALVSWRPLIRRRVDRRCGSCALCADVCPMGAIEPDNFRATRHGECILCRSCQDICPKSSVSFGAGDDEAETAAPAFVEARRQLVVGGLAGIGMAAMGFPGWTAGGAGSVAPETLRPPGALPEPDFLASCVRCGACIAVCPPNALQPLYVEAGLDGLFAPGLVPAGGPCDPHCTRCGEVCPTGAIRHLAGDERLWAKTGTAEIDQARCIAWAEGQRCMVCDEVCPFAAVVFRLDAGHPVAVPTVETTKCAGCGYCENACPVKGPAAIRVSAKGALRLAAGSYEAEGRRLGLAIALDARRPAEAPYPGAAEGDSAPGFDGPAPGFSR
jgi:ferredoxin